MEGNMLLNQEISLAEQKRSTFSGGECLLTAGMFYTKQGDYELALDYLNKAFLLFHRYAGPEWSAAITKTNKAIGSVYYQQGQFAKALDYYHLAEAVTEDSKCEASEIRI
jgi:tetratricopeptide (TPR) repeat protein